jgi:hypothetical protein
MAGLALMILGLLARDLAEVAWRWNEVSASVGVDFILYRDATSRWLSGGEFYGAFQLAGPYDAYGLPSILYPPPALLLFAPFVVLPAILWWMIPIGITTIVAIHHRPLPVAWPVLALCLWYPTTSEVIYAGNPVLWVVAALALATVWGWPGVLVLLKPSLLPFALVGANRRSWWMAGVVFGLVSLLFLPMWFDYARVLLNARDPNGLFYSLNQVPTLLIPVVAWLGRRPRAGAPGRSPTRSC